MRKILVTIGLLSSLSAFGSNDTVKSVSRLKGSVALQGNYNFGNYNNYTIGYKIDAKYIFGKSSIELLSTCRYTKTGSKPDSLYLKERELYNIISYSYLVKSVKFIAYSEQENSFLRKINLRYSLGVGCGYKFFNSKKFVVELSEVVLPETKYFTDKIHDINNIRLSTRFKVLYDNKPLRISNIVLYQPSIWNSKGVDNTIDLNIRNSTTIDVTAYKNISIGLNNEYVMQKYIHYVYPNKRMIDNSLTFYIKYYFQ